MNGLHLSLQQVAVHYGDRCAVRPVDLDVDRGGWVALVGPNGAGKSSLLRAIAGLVACDGTLGVDGVDLGALSPRERAKRIAFVPQDPVIPGDMAVADYVLLGRWPYVGRFGRDTPDDRATAAESIAQLGLTGFEARPLAELSGGERQRVVLARALAQRTPVLLLDEPTAALDIGRQQQALELVAALRHELGLTVIAAMHDLTLAGLYGDRIVMLDEGAVVADGPAVGVLTRQRISEVYSANVDVRLDAAGNVVVSPVR